MAVRWMRNALKLLVFGGQGRRWLSGESSRTHQGQGLQRGRDGWKRDCSIRQSPRTTCFEDRI